jgi:hypothetical protein
MTGTAHFEHSDYPAINQRSSNITEYWESLETGKNVDFLVHKPVLGFSLVDMSPVYEKSRAFYRARE